MSHHAADDFLSANESYWVLAYAILDSLADDLGWAKANGMWEVTPNELRQNFSPIATFNPVAMTGNDLYIQYNQESTHALMALLKDSANIKMDQSTITRRATQVAREILKIKNRSV